MRTRLVIDLDSVDEGLKVSLAEGHRTGAEILEHRATELFDQRRVDLDLRRCRDRASFPGRLLHFHKNIRARSNLITIHPALRWVGI